MTEPAPASIAAGGEAAYEALGHRVTVRCPDGDAVFACRPGEPMLFAGLRHGVSLPYACATGTCGSCRLRGNPADVDLIWADAPGRAKLKADRDILLCQSAPRRGCEIESRVSLPWPAGLPRPDHLRGRIASRHLVAREVMAFSVVLDRPVAFVPGQFVVIRTPAGPGYRAYSMVNADAPATELRFVIRRKPGGLLSHWLFDDACDDSSVDVFGPLGTAVLRPEDDAHLVIIAGSSGLAGPMAILARSAALGLFDRRRADVFFGVRTLADAFLLDALANLTARWPKNVRVTLALSDEVPATSQHPVFPAIALAHGDVHAVAARQISGPRAETLAFVAGPPPMVDAAIRLLLTTARLPGPAIHHDRFW